MIQLIRQQSQRVDNPTDSGRWSFLDNPTDSGVRSTLAVTYRDQVPYNAAWSDEELLGNIVRLSCASNKLTFLPPLPACQYLDCSNNRLTELPDLPACRSLSCPFNQLTTLPDLPVATHVYCYRNQLTRLSPGSKSVDFVALHCAYNRLTVLPNLPKCEVLFCHYNELLSLPELPVATTIDCSINHIETLPAILPRCIEFRCNNNRISKLPTLDVCEILECSKNRIPRLPQLLRCKILACPGNPGLFLDPLPVCWMLFYTVDKPGLEEIRWWTKIWQLRRSIVTRKFFRFWYLRTLQRRAHRKIELHQELLNSVGLRQCLESMQGKSIHLQDT